MGECSGEASSVIGWWCGLANSACCRAILRALGALGTRAESGRNCCSRSCRRRWNSVAGSDSFGSEKIWDFSSEISSSSRFLSSASFSASRSLGLDEIELNNEHEDRGYL